jgi:hypothetical protein
MKKDKIIKQTMKEIDFKRIERVMCFLNWRWYMGTDKPPCVPNKKQIKEKVRGMIDDVLSHVTHTNYVSSGGFTVEKIDNEIIKVTFSIEDVEFYYEE